MNLARRPGANRWISDFQFASSEAGKTRSDGFPPGVFFKIDSRAKTWTVLPSPMSSARQAPRPRLDRNQSQLTPVSWYFRRTAWKSSPGRARWRFSGLRRFASISPSHLPAPTNDHCWSGSPEGRSSARSLGAPARSRIPSMNEKPSPACSSTFFQWASASVSFSRSTSTHWPRSSTSPSSAASRFCHSSSVNSWSPKARWTWKSSIPWESKFFCRFWPMVTLTRGRGRFFHQSGSRTRMPLSSNTGTSRRNRYASRGVHASGWKRSLESINSLTSGLFSEASWTGDSSFSSVRLSFAPACCWRAWLSG